MADQPASSEPTASSLRQVVGALVFSSPVALDANTIRKCLREMPASEDGAKPPFADVLPRDIHDALADIQSDLDRLGLGIELREVAGGFRFQTQAGCGPWVRSLLKRDKPARLSRSALETLAIIAYRQPIAKSEMEGIRGVTVDHIIRALMEMHLVRIIGRSDLPGRPFLYGTTPFFLEHFGLRSLEELNDLDPTLQRAQSAQLPSRKKKQPAEGAPLPGLEALAEQVKTPPPSSSGPDTGAAAEFAALKAATKGEPVTDGN